MGFWSPIHKDALAMFPMPHIFGETGQAYIFLNIIKIFIIYFILCWVLKHVHLKY